MEDPLFPGQSSFHPQSTLSSMFSFFLSSRNPTRSQYGALSRWQVSGNIRLKRRGSKRDRRMVTHMKNKRTCLASMCVCMCHLYVLGPRTNYEVDVSSPASSRNKVISPMGHGHGDFVLSLLASSSTSVLHLTQSIGLMFSSQIECIHLTFSKNSMHLPYLLKKKSMHSYT